MVNLRLIISPFALVKHDVHNDSVEFLWPKEINYELLLNFNAYNMEINNPLYQIEKSKEMYNKKSNI